MTLLVPWLVFPLVLAALVLGCGLVLQRAAGGRLPPPVVLPAGLAVLTVAAGFTTLSERTAQLTVPAVVGIAVLGFGVGPRPSLRCCDPLPAACAVVAFLAVGAPVLISGEATFTGYVRLDDTATFLALIDHTFEHGRDLEGLAPSSYEATLSVNLAYGYPTGALLPLGTAARVVGTDPAWLFQPYLGFLAATLALGLYHLTGCLIRRRPPRAFAAAVASQPALLYGFAMWGGVKELFAAAMLALVAATLPLARDGQRGSVVPAAAAAALMLGMSVGALLWLVPAAIALLAASASRTRTAFVAATAALTLALPTVVESAQFLRGDNRSTFRDGDELGNLIGPIRPLQVLGIWPTGDFRTEPSDLRVTYVLLGASAVAALVGLAVAIRRRAFPLLTYAACCAVGALVLSALGSPWLEAKAFAVAAPGAALLALAGAWSVVAGGRRVEGLLLLAAVSGGVLWSNTLAARDATLAPHSQLAELESIGSRFAGGGPALMTEYQPYGVRHFLRRLDVEGASELRRRPIPFRDGRLPAKGESPEIDTLATDAVLVYRTLVLRRSPAGSRPPTPYTRRWRGRFYDVWQRSDAAPRVLAHVPLGDELTPAAPARCESVLALARLATRSEGVLAAARSSADSPLYVTPGRARSLCGASLDWVEALQPWAELHRADDVGLHGERRGARRVVPCGHGPGRRVERAAFSHRHPQRQEGAAEREPPAEQRRSCRA
jgi:hypothetical protein